MEGEAEIIVGRKIQETPTTEGDTHSPDLFRHAQGATETCRPQGLQFPCQEVIHRIHPSRCSHEATDRKERADRNPGKIV